MKIQKKIFFWGGGGGSGGEVGGGGVRVDVNQELKFFGKFQKKGGGVSGQDGCGRRIEVFVKIQFFFGGGGGGSGWGGGGGGGGGGSGWMGTKN